MGRSPPFCVVIRLVDRARRPRVLVAEDDHATGELLLELFDLEGFSVERAASLPALLDVLAAERVDVMLLDLTFPDTTAETLVARVRDVARRPPIVVFSARPSEEVAELAGLLGAAAVLPKPCPIDDMVATVRRVARG